MHYRKVLIDVKLQAQWLKWKKMRNMAVSISKVSHYYFLVAGRRKREAHHATPLPPLAYHNVTGTYFYVSIIRSVH